MEFLRRPVDVEAVLQLVFWNSDRGRTELALLRVADVRRDVPGNGGIVYTEALVRCTRLGQGLKAHELCTRAYELCPESETVLRWQCALHAAKLAPNPAALAKWARIVNRTVPRGMATPFTDKAERELEPLAFQNHVLADHSRCVQNGNFGDRAALAEIALDRTSLDRVDETTMRKSRALALRELDRQEAVQRTGLGEAYPAEQRLALLSAVEEMRRVVELDAYDAEAWNFLGAWFLLLKDYEKSIAASDRAIAVRPFGYSKPLINKAQALALLKRWDEAEEWTRRGLDAAVAAGDEAEIARAKAIQEKLKTGPEEAFEPGAAVRHVLSEAVNEGTIFADTIKSSAERLSAHLSAKCRLRGAGTDVLANLAELLMFFPPELAWKVIDDAESDARSMCMDASVLFAAATQGSQQRDALRLLALTVLGCGTPTEIRDQYRRAVTLLDLASQGGVRGLEALMRAELARIEPKLAEFVADQPLPEAAELDAIREGPLRRQRSFAEGWNLDV